MGDPLRLGQILINLVNNAVKFTERGEIVVTVALLRKRRTEWSAVFGSGYRDRHDTRADRSPVPGFQPARPVYQPQYGGTGLGLSICKRLVDMMEGKIWVESGSGRGSAFILRQGSALAAGNSQRALDPGIAGMRVLMVDDNAQAREILPSR